MRRLLAPPLGSSTARSAALCRPEGDRPVQEPGPGAGGTLARCLHGTGDCGPEPDPARLGGVLPSQPVGRACLARRVDTTAAALPRLGAMENAATACWGTGTPRGRQIGRAHV